MLRPYLTDTKRCYNHPHRTVTTACARCRLPLCSECLLSGDEADGLHCERCRQELAVLAEGERWRKRPWYRKLVPSRGGIQRAAIWTAVVLVVLVPMLWLARSIASTPLTADEVARISVAARGGFMTSEGIDVANSVLGASFVRASHASQAGHGPAALIDTIWQGPYPDWRSRETVFPQEIVFRLGNAPYGLSKAILRVHPDTPADSWVREFELLVSTTSPDGPWKSVGRWVLDQAQARATFDFQNPAEPQRFVFDETEAQYVMLRVWSSYGNQGYVSLAELELYWPIRSPR